MATGLAWMLSPVYVITLGVLAFVVLLVFANKLPTVTTWQSFLNCFESKGGQLVLLWVTDMLLLGVLVHYWKGWDTTLQTSVVGILSGVNGAFLGAVGVRQASPNGTNGTILPGAQVSTSTDTHEEVIRPAVPPLPAQPVKPGGLIPKS